jgi:outer membrane protein TolC
METTPSKTELLTNEYNSISEVLKTVDGDVAKLEEQIIMVKQQRLSLEYVLQALTNEIKKEHEDSLSPEPEQLEFDLCVD